MNVLTSKARSFPDWQQDMARGIRNVAELLKILQITPDDLPDDIDHDAEFSLRVPHSYVERMTRGDPHDPLLRQVLPLKIENKQSSGFAADPVGDLPAMIKPGLIHKYQGRILVITTGACAIHCRYCFRRHFPYSVTQARANEWQNVTDYIANDSSIKEVILSGGDPLTLSEQRLSSLTGKLAEIGHLKRLRIHTRLPVVLPARVDINLLSWIESIPLRIVIVIHANHPREINFEVRCALNKLLDKRVTLLNQSVLLQGVNDDPSTLINLSETLFAAGVIPYYLHLMDRVQGAAHFEVQPDRAGAIYQELLSSLPGFLVPRFVKERAGIPYKIPIVPCPQTP